MSFDLYIKSGDLVIGSNGDLKTIENTEKLVQDVLKMLLTPVGGNPFHAWYGSLIPSTLVGSPFDTEFILTMANSQIRSSLETLQNLQKVQTSSSQKVTASELLAAIKEVNIERNATDPRYFTIFISILTKALTSTETAINIRL